MTPSTVSLVPIGIAGIDRKRRNIQINGSGNDDSDKDNGNYKGKNTQGGCYSQGRNIQGGSRHKFSRDCNYSNDNDENINTNKCNGSSSSNSSSSSSSSSSNDGSSSSNNSNRTNNSYSTVIRGNSNIIRTASSQPVYSMMAGSFSLSKRTMSTPTPSSSLSSLSSPSTAINSPSSSTSACASQCSSYSTISPIDTVSDAAHNTNTSNTSDISLTPLSPMMPMMKPRINPYSRSVLNDSGHIRTPNTPNTATTATTATTSYNIETTINSTTMNLNTARTQTQIPETTGTQTKIPSDIMRTLSQTKIQIPNTGGTKTQIPLKRQIMVPTAFQWRSITSKVTPNHTNNPNTPNIPHISNIPNIPRNPNNHPNNVSNNVHSNGLNKGLSSGSSSSSSSSSLMSSIIPSTPSNSSFDFYGAHTPDTGGDIAEETRSEDNRHIDSTYNCSTSMDTDSSPRSSGQEDDRDGVTHGTIHNMSEGDGGDGDSMWVDSSPPSVRIEDAVKCALAAVSTPIVSASFVSSFVSPSVPPLGPPSGPHFGPPFVPLVPCVTSLASPLGVSQIGTVSTGGTEKISFVHLSDKRYDNGNKENININTISANISHKLTPLQDTSFRVDNSSFYVLTDDKPTSGGVNVIIDSRVKTTGTDSTYNGTDSTYKRTDAHTTGSTYSTAQGLKRKMSDTVAIVSEGKGKGKKLKSTMRVASITSFFTPR